MIHKVWIKIIRYYFYKLCRTIHNVGIKNIGYYFYVFCRIIHNVGMKIIGYYFYVLCIKMHKVEIKIIDKKKKRCFPKKLKRARRDLRSENATTSF